MDSTDLALVIALDGSASVTFDEFAMMAGGLGRALRQPDVVAGLIGGPRGASLAALLLWSGSNAQAVMIDWTRLTSEAEVADFAQAVEDVPRSVRPGETAIGEALIGCLKLLVHAPAVSARQVVNVAGDGRSNDGMPPGPVRDRMAAAGITINGLCVLHDEPDLLENYIAEVIGGPGAFAVTCQDFSSFADAMARKLTREVA